MIHPFRAWFREATAQLDALGVSRRRLTELGWSDFQEDPRPAGEQLHEFVADAMLMVCFDENGHWCNDVRILYAFIEATQVVSSRRVSDSDLHDVYAFALEGDQREDEIKFWLQVHFGPNAP